MFRLKIDIPLGNDETYAANKAVEFMNWLIIQAKKDNQGLIYLIQFLLADDTDRKVRNYLVKDSNGHATTKKMKVPPENTGDNNIG